MSRFLRSCAFVLAAYAGSAALAASDPLLLAFEESKAAGKGLNFLVNGQSIAGVVVSFDERFVVARSQAQGTIVIRLDRIDGVAGFVAQPLGDRKPQ